MIWTCPVCALNLCYTLYIAYIYTLYHIWCDVMWCSINTDMISRITMCLLRIPGACRQIKCSKFLFSALSKLWLKLHAIERHDVTAICNILLWLTTITLFDPWRELQPHLLSGKWEDNNAYTVQLYCYCNAADQWDAYRRKVSTAYPQFQKAHCYNKLGVKGTAQIWYFSLRMHHSSSASSSGSSKESKLEFLTCFMSLFFFDFECKLTSSFLDEELVTLTASEEAFFTGFLKRMRPSDPAWSSASGKKVLWVIYFLKSVKLNVLRLKLKTKHNKNAHMHFLASYR